MLTDELRCVGSVHVPGCVHTSPPPAPLEIVPGLSIRMDVGVSRRGRGRCPVCKLRRVLFSLSAFAADQPIGYGEAKCLPCAGLR